MSNTFSKIIYALYALYFILNITGSPLIPYLYVIIAIAVALKIITSPFEIGIYSLILFSFIEGQGRVVLGYNVVARAALDILIMLIFFKALVSHKSLFVQKYLPQFMKLMIAFHFLWWVAELFHPLGLPPWFSVLTARYYVMPLFLFTLALNIDITENNSNFNNFCIAVIFFYIAQIIISYVQFFGGSDFLNNISINYTTLFEKFSRFQGKTFRAFGTSFVPGGYVTHLFLGTPLLLLIKQDKAWYKYFILPLIIIAAWAAFFLSGVRSAWIKNLMIIYGSLIFLFLKNRFKFKASIKMILTFILFVGLSALIIPNIQLKNTNYDLTGKIARVMQLLSNSEEVHVGGETIAVRQKKKHRIDLDDFMQLLLKTELPFGTGPGMGGVNVPGVAEAKAQRIDKDLNFFWTGDNLYVFLIFELGLGAFFIIMVIFTLPFYFLKGAISALKTRNTEFAKILGICFIFTITVIIGNWGAVGILLAPESLFFWFISGIGIRQYFKSLQPTNECSQ